MFGGSSTFTEMSPPLRCPAKANKVAVKVVVKNKKEREPPHRI